jgi:hypothetical protein
MDLGPLLSAVAFPFTVSRGCVYALTLFLDGKVMLAHEVAQHFSSSAATLQPIDSSEPGTFRAPFFSAQEKMRSELSLRRSGSAEEALVKQTASPTIPLTIPLMIDAPTSASHCKPRAE